MRESQRAMAAFLPLVDWTRFRPRNLNDEGAAPGFHLFACADDRQAIAWMMRRGGRDRRGMVPEDSPPRSTKLTLPLPSRGEWRLRVFDTRAGKVVRERRVAAGDGPFAVTIDGVGGDVAVAARRVD